MVSGALDEGAELAVIDTSGLVSGVYGQLLKYHKIELLQPDGLGPGYALHGRLTDESGYHTDT